MNAPNWEVRRTAAFLLREFGGNEGLRELQPLLTDSEPLVQREAIQALVLNGSEAASQILVNALNATSGRPRQTLVNELMAMRDERAGPLFCHLTRQLDRRKFPAIDLSGQRWRIPISSLSQPGTASPWPESATRASVPFSTRAWMASR